MVRGDFNNFADRDDCALIADGNGHWRGFIPGVTDGQQYKYGLPAPTVQANKRDPYGARAAGSILELYRA